MPNLYWKAVFSTEWTDATNWFLDAEATIPALDFPWEDTSTHKYLDYHLLKSTGSTEIVDMGGSYSGTATGVCYLGDGINLYSGASITGSMEFAGDGFSNSATINAIGSVFSGDNFINRSVDLGAGTFSGDNFINDFGGSIGGGIFTGRWTNYGIIIGGDFYGRGTYSHYGSINGGTFHGDAVYSLLATVPSTNVVINGSGGLISFQDFKAGATDVLGAGLF
jgi:hypothetical protein